MDKRLLDVLQKFGVTELHTKKEVLDILNNSVKGKIDPALYKTLVDTVNQSWGIASVVPITPASALVAKGFVSTTIGKIILVGGIATSAVFGVTVAPKLAGNFKIDEEAILEYAGEKEVNKEEEVKKEESSVETTPKAEESNENSKGTTSESSNKKPETNKDNKPLEIINYTQKLPNSFYNRLVSIISEYTLSNIDNTSRKYSFTIFKILVDFAKEYPDGFDGFDGEIPVKDIEFVLKKYFEFDLDPLKDLDELDTSYGRLNGYDPTTKTFYISHWGMGGIYPETKFKTEVIGERLIKASVYDTKGNLLKSIIVEEKDDYFILRKIQ